MGKIKLDKDEQEILESFERGEWTSVQNVKAEIAKHQQIARKTLKKDKRVNIGISSKVLEEIQALAVENGIPPGWPHQDPPPVATLKSPTQDSDFNPGWRIAT